MWFLCCPWIFLKVSALGNWTFRFLSSFTTTTLPKWPRGMSWQHANADQEIFSHPISTKCAVLILPHPIDILPFRDIIVTVGLKMRRHGFWCDLCYFWSPNAMVNGINLKTRFRKLWTFHKNMQKQSDTSHESNFFRDRTSNESTCIYVQEHSINSCATKGKTASFLSTSQF